VRYGASSNYSSWQVSQMLCLAGSRDRQPLRIAQQMYNLLARGLEQEFLPMSREFGVSLIAYNPLAGGLLTGKHIARELPPARGSIKTRCISSATGTTPTLKLSSVCNPSPRLRIDH
jgi:aryl-alcohol dehydrogenase-like predicted oxidoreductase